MIYVVTGGSGFIGTNLIEHLISIGEDVINLDLVKPQNPKHNKYWVKCDINSMKEICSSLHRKKIKCLIHLAARTDLSGRTIREYRSNILGVYNVAKYIYKNHPNTKTLFASSMLVCKIGYSPKDAKDYSPNTIYGLSKVKGELIAKKFIKKGLNAIIFRPTSIWGEWFREPYLSFFLSIKSRHYISTGLKNKKTFGYVGNAILQILSLENVCNINVNQYIYIGDENPINPDFWADTIAEDFRVGKPFRMPFIMLKILAKMGDVLAIFRIRFPLNSFRLINLTSDNIVDVKFVHTIVKDQFTLKDGIKRTVLWLKKINS